MRSNLNSHLYIVLKEFSVEAINWPPSPILRVTGLLDTLAKAILQCLFYKYSFKTSIYFIILHFNFWRPYTAVHQKPTQENNVFTYFIR